jgi:hypothetical protein
MMATAWDNVPENQATGDQVLGPQPPDLVNKLNTERVELAQKIERLKTFMTLDAKFQELSYRHQNLLQDQLLAMSSYESTLVERMTLLNTPNDK